MKKTTNKWNEISPVEIKIGNILKIASAVVFLFIWTPGFIWVIIQVINLITK